MVPVSALFRKVKGILIYLSLFNITSNEYWVSCMEVRGQRINPAFELERLKSHVF